MWTVLIFVLSLSSSVISDNVYASCKTFSQGDKPFEGNIDWYYLYQYQNEGDIVDGCEEVVMPASGTRGMNLGVSVPDGVGYLKATLTPATGETADMYTIAQNKRTPSSGNTLIVKVDANSDRQVNFVFSRNGPAPATDSTVVSHFEITFDETECNAGAEDPIFTGLNGQKFEFDGHPGRAYNVFSDPHMSLNSLFDFANINKHKGTIMSAHCLRLGSTTIVLNSTSFQSGSIETIVNGEVNSFKEDDSDQVIGDCIKVMVKTNKIIFNTPTHAVSFYNHQGKSNHINNRHIDFKLEHPAELLAEVGGIIGQTASRVQRNLDLEEKKFLTSNLLSLDAPTNVFQGKEIDCQANDTNKRNAQSQKRCI